MLANGGIDPRKVSAEENVVKEVSENDLKTTDNEKDQKASSSDEKIDNDLNKIKEQKIDTEEENIISSVN